MTAVSHESLLSALLLALIQKFCQSILLARFKDVIVVFETSALINIIIPASCELVQTVIKEHKRHHLHTLLQNSFKFFPPYRSFFLLELHLLSVNNTEVEDFPSDYSTLTQF